MIASLSPTLSVNFSKHSVYLAMLGCMVQLVSVTFYLVKQDLWQVNHSDELSSLTLSFYALLDIVVEETQ